jgi:hypothetical protein
VADLGTLATVDEYEDAVQRAMEHEEVDALIALYACVGNCDPQLVGRALRRGVARARRRTGITKPALLCLMGAEGRGHFAIDEAGGAAPVGQVLPAYRFPESAALALARAAQYAEFRRRPAGRVVWHEDVNAAAARQEVRAALESAPGDALWLEAGRARDMLRLFGIATQDADIPPIRGDVPSVSLEIRSDRSFGPLLCLVREGGRPLVRITPLTDHDARELVNAAGLAGAGMEELLGRISRMVEELPWLSGMNAQVFPGHPQAGEAGAALGRGVRIGFNSTEVTAQPDRR